MTCLCGNQFCFNCGVPWNQKTYQCSGGTCQLWEDNDMLLDEDRRLGRPIAKHIVGENVMAEFDLYNTYKSFDWIYNEGSRNILHYFTSSMIQHLSCGYCGSRMDGLAQLRYHLANIKRHPVYSCCGTFFRLREDYADHRRSIPANRHWRALVRNDEV